MAGAFDIQPSGKKPAPRAAQAPVRRSVEPMRRPSAPAPRPSVASPRAVPTRRESIRTTAPAPRRTPLRQRRKSERKKLFYIGLIIIVLLFTAVEVVLWQPALRVSNVEASGPSSDALKTFVQNELIGTRYLVIPKSSIFFIPQKEIRARILAAFPDVEAVSLAPSGLNTLTIKTTGRASVFWWCGESVGTPLATCYQADSQGLIFAQVPAEQMAATSSTLSIYGALTKHSEASSSPVGNSIQGAAQLPALIQFEKTMRTLGADIVSIDIRGDEADLYTRAGTRITYVLGREQQAAGLAATAFPTLKLNDGSLLYIDLRFDSKVFFKKKGAP